MSGLLPDYMEGMTARHEHPESLSTNSVRSKSVSSDSTVPHKYQDNHENKDIAHKLLLNIKSQLPVADHPLSSAAHHHFAEPGKLIRGQIACATGDMLELPREIAMQWALSVEFLHNASLVHDDICDEDTSRRNRDTIWKAFGHQQAICLGDWMVAQSFIHAAEADSLLASKAGHQNSSVALLAKGMSALSTGQASEFVSTAYPNWAHYSQIVSGKTGQLISIPVEGIYVLANLHHDYQRLENVFGNLGLAYQITNDIKNLMGTDGAARQGGDVLRQSPNAVVILFRDSLVNGSRKEFDEKFMQGSVCAHTDEKWMLELSMTGSKLAADKITSLLAEVEKDLDDDALTCGYDMKRVLLPVTDYLAAASRKIYHISSTSNSTSNSNSAS